MWQSQSYGCGAAAVGSHRSAVRMGGLEFQLGHDLWCKQGPAGLAAVMPKHLLAFKGGYGALRLALPHPRFVSLGSTVQAVAGLADQAMANWASQGKFLIHGHLLELVGWCHRAGLRA